MKKFMPFILLLIFFAGQINLAWASHYCDGKLVEAELTVAPQAHNCCGGDAEAAKDCCDDQVVQADSDDFFKKTEANQTLSPELILVFSFLLQGFVPEISVSNTIPQYSPDFSVPDYQVLHQTFLI